MSLGSPNRIFLLSPANCSGRRAEILLRQQAQRENSRRVSSRAIRLAGAAT